MYKKNLLVVLLKVKTLLDSERREECIDFTTICFFFYMYVDNLGWKVCSNL